MTEQQALEFHIRYSPLLVMVVVLAIVAHALAALIHARAVETLQNSTADAPPKLVQGRAAKVIDANAKISDRVDLMVPKSRNVEHLARLKSHLVADTHPSK